ncbi:glucose-1-phosphate thymidylyltransferase [Candidatus Saccharibacteria bacterium 49-20]|nr:MAG: glucose-1-phosphate thymidylyltransferase [Candidatus Saccharibacteria bacterium 49-20]
MKGIILAAGKGTRLGPITLGLGEHGTGVSKPLVPVYDKPTIYYPLANLISAGIKDILIICAPDSIDQFQKSLGDGSDLGINLAYTIQHEPKGTADALIIGEEFIGDDSIALIYGDNVIHSEQFGQALKAATNPSGATIFAYSVQNPESFGVVEFDTNNKVLSVEEKPAQPKSNYAIMGVYFYTNEAITLAKQLEISERGEYEITGVNDAYLEDGRLDGVPLGLDTHWFDTGNPDALSDASSYVRAVQKETGRLIGSPELAAFEAGFIDKTQLAKLAEPLMKSEYGKTLARFAE